MKRIILLFCLGMMLTSCGIFQDEASVIEEEVNPDIGDFESMNVDGTDYVLFDFQTNTSAPTSGDHVTVTPEVDTLGTTVIQIDNEVLGLDESGTFELTVTLY